MDSTAAKQVLHVGCGTYAPEKLHAVFRNGGWREVRLDIDPAVQPDIVASMTDMSPVADGSVDAVFSSHNLEHLYPHDVLPALKEFKRVLSPTGFVLITVPDIQEVARLVSAGNLTEPAYMSAIGPIAPLDILYGHRASMVAGNLFMAHRTGFTGKALMDILTEAGFAVAAVQRVPPAFCLWAIAFRAGPSNERLLEAQNQMFPLNVMLSAAQQTPMPQAASLTAIRSVTGSALVSAVEAALATATLTAMIDTSAPFYAVPGMSGRRYRQFVNSLVRSLPSPAYLEVGSWAGSTLCSAIYGNQVRAIAIDNWSEFGGPKDEFIASVEQCIGPGAEVFFIESDFRAVDYAKLGKFGVYLFDGPHERQDQYDALTLALPAMLDEFVFIVDDWNWEQVRAGTFAAIRETGLTVACSAEIRTTLDDSHPDHACGTSDWHNGYYIAVLRKPATCIASSLAY